MLTPSFQQRYHIVEKQNTCWTKPDKATLGFRSGTANRSYLHAIPGSHSNTEPDEFTLVQACRTVSPFILSTEISFQIPSAPHFSAPTTTIHADCLTAGHPHGKQTHSCYSTVNTNCRIHCWQATCLHHQDTHVSLTTTAVLPACCYSVANLPFNTATSTGRKQASDSAETPSAHPKPSRLSSLASCVTDQKTHCWT